MQLTYKALTLPLEFTFTISRSSQQVAETVLVELSAEVNGQTVTGVGEAVPAAFYGETCADVQTFYDMLKTTHLLEDVSPLNRQRVNALLANYPGHYAAKSALDCACWDIAGKVANLPVYALLGLDAGLAPKTSYTLGIADMPTYRHKLQTALQRGYEVLKIKLGGENDDDCLALTRELAPHATLRVDANAAWTLEQARHWLPRLAELGVEFVEEPLRLDSPESAYQALKAESPLPLMADESCHRLTDIPKCAEFFHAINLKLGKTGGLTEAIRMIHAARAHQLKIMLGCFTESALAITAMAQISPLVDYADLDGHLLVQNSPFVGVEVVGSQLHLPTRPGLGVLAVSAVK
jgi:L-Ala-D/L-Glu epimerase